MRRPFICRTEADQFLTYDGIKLRFTVINQQDSAPPESGQIPARAFDDKTLMIIGEGNPSDGAWIYSARVVNVFDAALDVIAKGISTGNT